MRKLAVLAAFLMVFTFALGNTASALDTPDGPVFLEEQARLDAEMTPMYGSISTGSQEATQDYRVLITEEKSDLDWIDEAIQDVASAN